LTARPLTGPAAQAINDRGFVPSLSKTAARVSSRLGKFFVLRRCPGSSGAPDAGTSANRAFVPPMSQRRTGKGNFTPRDFHELQTLNNWATANQAAGIMDRQDFKVIFQYHLLVPPGKDKLPYRSSPRTLCGSRHLSCVTSFAAKHCDSSPNR
jgi:hypothetical protein